MGTLPDKGVPAYIKITPVHLAATCLFLGVLRIEFDSNLGQEPAVEANDGSRWICMRGACFLPSELVRELYKLGSRPTIAKVFPQLFASALALTKDTPAYKNVLEWVQSSFTKVVWRNHPSLSFLEVPIRTSRYWETSDFESNSQEGQQEAEFI